MLIRHDVLYHRDVGTFVLTWNCSTDERSRWTSSFTNYKFVSADITWDTSKPQRDLVDCCVSNLYLCPVFWESCASSKIDCPYNFVGTKRRNSIVLALKVMWIFTFRFLSWLALLCLYETDVAVTFYSLTFCIGILLSWKPVSYQGLSAALSWATNSSVHGVKCFHTLSRKVWIQSVLGSQYTKLGSQERMMNPSLMVVRLFRRTSIKGVKVFTG